MKKILGLDLGTNSIGWAVVNADEKVCENEETLLNLSGIDSSGSRILPMDAAQLGDFEKGNTVSQTNERTGFRGTRRLIERNLLRRERLHRVLDIMGFLPAHFADKLDRYGKFTDDSELKLAWKKGAEGTYEFLFKDSFNEMIAEFKKTQPQLFHVQSNGKEPKIPYDWTIYYLRKKALLQAISKEELAWLLLNFNQKRGYYQLRGEDEEKKENQLVEYHPLKVVSVEDSGEKKKDEVWYNVHLENGWIYRRSSKTRLDWEGKTKEFIVTTDLNDDGSPKTDKEGIVKRSFRAPKEEDWTLLKKKTELDIDRSQKTIGTYIYDALLEKPAQKIKGKLVRTIERKYYKEELRLILEKQKNFIPELQDKDLYIKCLNELYSINDDHKKNVRNRDFTYLFIDDIIFYQRPLKSKKSLIDDCPYESRFDKDGNKRTVKCMSKSNPIYQEFRLWQFISNLRIYQREKDISGNLKTDVDVTSEFLKSEEDIVALFDWLNDHKEIDQKGLLKYPAFKLGETIEKFRWNYVEDKTYPCNETRALMISRMKKAGIDKKNFLKEKEEERKEFEMKLWHILYSVEDKLEIQKALKKFAANNDLPDLFVEAFSKCPPFKKEYGAYSEKATKKLLSLMRMGKYWNDDKIDLNTKDRIDKIITGEVDETIRNRVREKAINLKSISDFRGLPVWLACYVVYDRHSEAKDIIKWENPSDIDDYLKSFKQHSLRNPIVEQVITETLRTVRDIWKQVGHIDEIHVELGRDMKNPADKRKKISEQISDNENANLRIKTLLTEFKNPEYEIENVRLYSPSQQDLLRIYEDGVLNSVSEIPEDVESILKKFKEIDEKKRPTSSEIKRYKLWLEQKYRSPYTGQIIPLAKLFTSAYEIEHIIPQSRYFDDSFINKVICESEVNKLKDNALGYEFIKKHHGEKVQLSQGKIVEILSVEDYVKFVKDNYSRSRLKMQKLLMEDIPDNFIERQLNDSRYISKVVKSLLSNIVREKDENGNYEQESTSKNLISTNGSITDYLKRDWGMKDVWNRIILPRFQRLNQLTNKKFTTINAEGHEIPYMPLELQKGFNKKRIDHRHHVMDAIVVACATRDHVNLLNNEAAKAQNQANRYQLSHKLRRYENIMIAGKERSVPREFIKPWDTFTEDAYAALEKIVVSFKQNLRVINKTVNKYQHYENGKKVFVKQEKGDSWAIRKSMHKDTVYGEVNLQKTKDVRLSEALKSISSIVDKVLKNKIKELVSQGYDEKKIIKYFENNKDVWAEVNLAKIKVYTFSKDTKDRYFAVRKSLDASFDRETIESVTDTGIQKILLRHLENKGNDPAIAFSPDGIDEMNRNIVALNNGKLHHPILKVRKYEKGDKFAIGEKGNKKAKFVEAAKGTNLYFAVYESINIDKKTNEETKSRSFVTIPLNVIIDCQKKSGKFWENTLDCVLKEKGIVTQDGRLLFTLSPNDLVYLPENGQIISDVASINKGRIYKMVSSNKTGCFFIQSNVAKSVVDKSEFTTSNKMEKAITGEMIKDICIPIKVDRLGNIIEVFKSV